MERTPGDLPVSPAAERNKQPILEALVRRLPDAGTVLEIASGTGQHVVHFARAVPSLRWQPTDPDPGSVATIRRRLKATGLGNVDTPRRLDVRERPWPVEAPAAILCCNMIHIAPWTAGEALLAEAGRLLPPTGPLFLYGPFREGGEHTAPSNAAFDADLRARDPEWGVRDLETVAETAAQAGLRHTETLALPANNRLVVFRAEG